jgi:hypothetical protein
LPRGVPPLIAVVLIHGEFASFCRKFGACEKIRGAYLRI